MSAPESPWNLSRRLSMTSLSVAKYSQFVHFQPVP